MKFSLTRKQGVSPIGAIGLALMMLGVCAPSVSHAQSGNRDHDHDTQQEVRHAPQRAPHDYRHDYHHDERHYSSGYRDGGYAYGPPPVIYAPEASPGISLFLPLEFR
ncbi:hypothetical protein PAN31117_01848 [Pandoraea anapnoica]|uniref:Uncharacterized protein n=1 Tax=Pandoraea anapnoica TaxID=2508301 RepID=A0A5E4ZVP1_9BURK|nr:hypothetical protein [Pandoraea anapnoica]VVE65374.1 hypothetical protein PAN31117_01848 [Pandoraea anapnoica]